MPEATARADSFKIDQEVEILAPPEKAWAALLDVDGWWCHRMQRGDSTLVLEPAVGGRFYERWKGDEGALWGVVTLIRRPEVLRLSGPLGSSTGANSVYEVRLEPRGKATVLRLWHRCTGDLSPDARGDYDGGWKALWVHLKALAETGKRFIPR